MMRAKGLEVSVLGVLDMYSGLLDVVVVDQRDMDRAEAIRSRGVRALATDIVMADAERETSLARRTLEALG
jgi:hypothetical protein